MSNQPENENQQTVTPEEVREYLLAELEASKQTIAELSDEQLEEVAGGGISLSAAWQGGKAGYQGAKFSGKDRVEGFIKGAWEGSKNKPGLVNQGIQWLRNSW